MKAVFRSLILVLSFLAYASIFLLCPQAQARDDEEITMVGRISHVEGKLLRYIEEESDWVLTVKDAPFGLEDALYSGDYGKAEFMMPNRTWLRVGENTQVQLIDLNSEATTLDVASGLARLYNKSRDVMIKVTTPFGYLVAPGGTVFDLYVGDSSLEVIAVDGDVDFVHYGTNSRYEVLEGYSSIIADDRDVVSGNGTVDAIWDDWNGERDELWENRLRRSTYSAGFLPESIREDSYYLEEHGQWERVYYEGAYWDMWRPTRVERGWRPFTAGRWTVYYGDHCWVPDEPFGYVTHHYGTWIYVESHRGWFWMPPAARFVPERPRFFVSFGWHPGRVGWIHSGRTIGWVPLAWDEEYYGHRRWGHRTVVVRPQTVININIYRYRFLDEAVVIPRDHFYRGTRYTEIVRHDVGRDVIINNYQPVTVINNTVINNFNIEKRRFAYNDVEVDRKPHVTVVNRINANHRNISKIERIGRERIERDLTRFDLRSEAPPAKEEVPKPVLTPKLVEPDKISRPITTLNLEKKEIKPRERERRLTTNDEQQRRQRDRGRPERDGDSARKGEQRAKDTASEPGQVTRQQGEAARQEREQQHSQAGRRSEKEIEPQQAEDAKGRRGPRLPAELRSGDSEGQQLRESGKVQDSGEEPRLRSPRDKRDPDQRPRSQDLGQPEAASRLPEKEIEPQQTEDAKGRRGPRRPAELRQGDSEGQQLRELGEVQGPVEKPRLRSPRDMRDPDRQPRSQDLRQPEAASRSPEQEIERQTKERRGTQRPRELRQEQAVEQPVPEGGQTQEIVDQPRLRSPRHKAGQDEQDSRQEGQQKNNSAREHKIELKKQEEVRQRQEPEALERQAEADRQQQRAAQAARQKKEAESARQQELVRQQKENQQREEVRQRQEREVRERQAEADRQQQRAAQAAKQKREEESARQQELVRQQKENQQREEVRQRQEREARERQAEADRQQQQAAQAARQKREEESARQQKENQLRDQRRQEQETKHRQEQEARQRQAEVEQRQQLEHARRQEARQQKENQAREQQKVRQKQEQDRPPEQARKQEQDRQPEQIQAEEQNPQQERKKKKQQEEEQQQPPR